MNNDENWENEIDWSRRTSVVGGPAFYEFVKDKAIPVLDDGIRQLEAAKARCEDKMRRWGGIAERAGKLADSFAALIECEDFMSMVQDFDEKTTEMFKGAGFPTLGGWMRIGKRFTDALRDGSTSATSSRPATMTTASAAHRSVSARGCSATSPATSTTSPWRARKLTSARSPASSTASPRR